MTHTPDAPESSFTVRCSYCRGTHTASLTTAPYGGTYHDESRAYGIIYGVVCERPLGEAAQHAPVRYGVFAQTNCRI